MEQLEFEKTIHEETKGLPDNVLSEILDFVLFLKNKMAQSGRRLQPEAYAKRLSKNKKSPRKNKILAQSNKDRKNSFQAGINRELDRLDTTELIHLEEEFKDYKELYPHER